MRRRSARRWSSRPRSGGCELVGDRFRLETTGGPLEARSVVVATGGFHVPHRPPIAEQVPRTIFQLHSQDYRNASSLPQGAVLVVGIGTVGRPDRRGAPGGRAEGLPVGRQRRPLPAPLPRERHLPLAGRGRGARRGARDPAADGGQAGRPAPAAGREPALLGARRRSRHEPPPVRGRGDDAPRPDRGRRRSATPSRPRPGRQPGLGRPVLRRALPRPLRRVHRAGRDRRPARRPGVVRLRAAGARRARSRAGRDHDHRLDDRLPARLRLDRAADLRRARLPAPGRRRERGARPVLPGLALAAHPGLLDTLRGRHRRPPARRARWACRPSPESVQQSIGSVARARPQVVVGPPAVHEAYCGGQSSGLLRAPSTAASTSSSNSR